MNKVLNRGFTLIEVLVSLAILTISLSAIITVGSNRAETLIELRNKNRALVVANNVLEKYSLLPINGSVVDGKQQNGATLWSWQLRVVPTQNALINRLDVTVSKDSSFDYAYAKLTGFKAR